MINLWYDYENWLLNRVGFYRLLGYSRPVKAMDNKYSKLIRYLHNSDFMYCIDRDENRSRDGLALREEYFDELAIADARFVDKRCSILEMLVALALRVDDEYVGDPADPHPEVIFWDMISNLGLKSMSNDRFNEEKVSKILNIWLFREFEFDGKNGIFPIKFVTFDQRDSEIWNQMMAYINENY